MIRYFRPASSEPRRPSSEAHRTYSGIDRQLEAEEQRDEVLRLQQHEHSRDGRQQQRVVLAFAGHRRRRGSQRQRHARRRGADRDEPEQQRQIVDAQGPGDQRGRVVPAPDRQSRGGAEHEHRQRRDSAATRGGRAQQPDQQHDHGAAEQRDQRRQPGPVDVRAVDVGGRGHPPAPAGGALPDGPPVPFCWGTCWPAPAGGETVPGGGAPAGGETLIGGPVMVCRWSV